MTEKKRFWSFLLIAFGGGWLLQGLGILLGSAWYQICVALCMFMPMLGVLISHGSLRKERTCIRWEPQVRGHGGWYLAAWLGPAVISILCAAWFFLLFPDRFDANLSYVTAQLPAEGELPIPPLAMAAVQFVQAITYAPFLNAILAVGEEVGWRGYMTPYLAERFGRRAGLLLSGALWAVWHWPLILLAGYEYGTGYPGAPFTGMLLMCLGCTTMGILLTLLYDKSGSIWAPALAHGALNAAAGIGVLFLHAGETALFLGPTPLGLVSGIPLFVLAAYVLLRKIP